MFLEGGGGGSVLVAKLCPTLVTPRAVARQAPLSMGFSRQEYWIGLPFPMPENLPDPGMEPMSLVSAALAGRFFSTEPYCHSSNSLMVYIIDPHCL